MITYFDIAGLIIGIAGLVIAWFQYIKTKRLVKFIRANNWYNYHRMNNANGTLQVALKQYKLKHKENIDPDVLELLARSDAFGQEVVKETVRSIQIHEPSFSVSDFAQWKNEGKIDDNKVDLFKQFMISPNKKKLIFW